MADTFLDNILKHKAEVIASKKDVYANLKQNITRTEYSRYSIFKRALQKEGEIALIAELKKASPSKGVIREDFRPVDLAKTYKDAGASALSVLTEDKYFQGSPQYLKDVSEEVALPTLTKDFILDEGQIYEACYCGASAILLIVAILEDDQIKQFIEIAAGLDLDCLVETHDEAELERALNCNAEIIGINNRDLKSFHVDLATSEKIIPQIPKDKVIVAESGLKTNEDIQRLQAAGANAVLIGETFLREQDVAKKVKDVMHGEG